MNKWLYLVGKTFRYWDGKKFQEKDAGKIGYEIQKVANDLVIDIVVMKSKSKDATKAKIAFVSKITSIFQTTGLDEYQNIRLFETFFDFVDCKNVKSNPFYSCDRGW